MVGTILRDSISIASFPFAKRDSSPSVSVSASLGTTWSLAFSARKADSAFCAGSDVNVSLVGWSCASATSPPSDQTNGIRRIICGSTPRPDVSSSCGASATGGADVSAAAGSPPPPSSSVSISPVAPPSTGSSPVVALAAATMSFQVQSSAGAGLQRIALGAHFHDGPEGLRSWGPWPYGLSPEWGIR